jgi:dTDP-4-amino-4,6-dideoxygalactose transaminase
MQIYTPRSAKYRTLKPFLKRIDKSRNYSNFGKLQDEFAKKISKYLNTNQENIAFCSNGTLALMGLVQTICASKTLIKSPSWTFPATPLAIIHSGRNLEFVDVSEITWESSLPYQEDYGIHVSAFGGPISITETIKNKSLAPLIIDAAASFMNLQLSSLPINRDWVVMVSLHATKSLSAGEGAFIYSNREDWVKEFKVWTNFGFDGSRETQRLSLNAKISEYACAVGLANLALIDNTKSKMQDLNEKCIRITKKLGLTNHPAMNGGFVTPYWILKFSSRHQKDKTKNFLDLNGIPSRDWWSNGCHKMPYFQHFESDNLAVTNNLASTTLGLPFHSYLKKRDLELISSAIDYSLHN